MAKNKRKKKKRKTKQTKNPKKTPLRTEGDLRCTG
jgi:hypothetical protein